MAFRNRNEMWEDLAKEQGCEIEPAPRLISYYVQGSRDPQLSTQYLFSHNGAVFFQPGSLPYSTPGQAAPLTGMLASAADGRKFAISGPDGNGEDLMIKSSEQFKDCVTEVVQPLESLETFGWDV